MIYFNLCLEMSVCRLGFSKHVYILKRALYPLKDAPINYHDV